MPLGRAVAVTAPSSHVLEFSSGLRVQGVGVSREELGVRALFKDTPREEVAEPKSLTLRNSS